MMNASFEMNGKTYRTDVDTLAALRSVMPSAKATGDSSAVAAIMSMGLHFGRIVEVSE